MFRLSILLVVLGRVLFSTITSSHQEPVLGQACYSSDPYQYLSLFFGVGVQRYPVPKWPLFHCFCWGIFMSA